MQADRQPLPQLHGATADVVNLVRLQKRGTLLTGDHIAAGALYVLSAQPGCGKSR